MAKKYSTGPTNGKNSSKYQAIAPDGSIHTKRSFFIHTNTAFLGMYLHKGVWYSSGVTESVMNWGSQIFVPAVKIS